MLLKDQEVYTPTLVRARLRMGGGFHARGLNSENLYWVTAIGIDNLVTIEHSFSGKKFRVISQDLKSL
jgi:hypothetical protein